MVNIKLSKPARLEVTFNGTGGGETSELNLREPTGNDLIECGMPWRWEIDDDGSSVRKMDTKAIGMLISKLSGVAYVAVNQMSAFDFMQASGAVLGFFQASVSAKPIPSTDISS